MSWEKTQIPPAYNLHFDGKNPIHIFTTELLPISFPIAEQ